MSRTDLKNFLDEMLGVVVVDEDVIFISDDSDYVEEPSDVDEVETRIDRGPVLRGSKFAVGKTSSAMRRRWMDRFVFAFGNRPTPTRRAVQRDADLRADHAALQRRHPVRVRHRQRWQTLDLSRAMPRTEMDGDEVAWDFPLIHDTSWLGHLHDADISATHPVRQPTSGERMQGRVKQVTGPKLKFWRRPTHLIKYNA